MSPSSRRAWIEISESASGSLTGAVALLAEGVDRNYKYLNTGTLKGTSPSSRRAWIEILSKERGVYGFQVALLAEGVDRNRSVEWHGFFPCVALLAEGVDRNT